MVTPHTCIWGTQVPFRVPFLSAPRPAPLCPDLLRVGKIAAHIRHDATPSRSAKVMNLLGKRAIEIVPPAQRESSFYSRYFLIPKKDGGLQPILGLRLLNQAILLVHLTNIAQAPTSLGLSILYGCQVSTYGTTLRPPLTLWLSLCLVYSLGSYSHMSLGVESFHVIARRDCTCSHTSVFDPVRVKYRKGTYLVTIVTFVL